MGNNTDIGIPCRIILFMSTGNEKNRLHIGISSMRRCITVVKRNNQVVSNGCFNAYYSDLAYRHIKLGRVEKIQLFSLAMFSSLQIRLAQSKRYVINLKKRYLLNRI